MRNDSLFAFIAGAAIGAAFGVLFAPAKGEETRRRIREAAQEGYDAACEKAGEAYGYAREKAADAYSYAQGKVAKAKADIEDLKAIIKEGSEEMKEEARARMLDHLDRLEKALAKDEEPIEEA